MKKLTLLIVIIGLLLSMACKINVNETVENSKSATTVELQELQKDTVLVIINNEKLSVFNNNNELIGTTVGITHNHVVIHIGIVFLAAAIIIILAMLLIAYIIND